jgi:hypothetical protein
MPGRYIAYVFAVVVLGFVGIVLARCVTGG